MKIGGYFELEFNSKLRENCFKNMAPLNSGRNSLRLLIRTKSLKKIYVPHFICSSVLEALEKEDVTMIKYHIDENLEIRQDIYNDDIPILYVNYFGIKDIYVKHLSSKYPNLIVDNSQALYSKPLNGVSTFYSPRKFLGIPDGGFLAGCKNIGLEKLEQDVSMHRMSHLLKRIELSPIEGYNDYRLNNLELGRTDIKRMSKLTGLMINSINHNRVVYKRKANFNSLHNELESFNSLVISLHETSVPMVYPFYIKGQGRALKDYLIKNSIFVATYWPNIMNETTIELPEKVFVDDIVSIPIDQRYSEKEMTKIIQLLKIYGSIY